MFNHPPNPPPRIVDPDNIRPLFCPKHSPIGPKTAQLSPNPSCVEQKNSRSKSRVSFNKTERNFCSVMIKKDFSPYSYKETFLLWNFLVEKIKVIWFQWFYPLYNWEKRIYRFLSLIKFKYNWKKFSFSKRNFLSVKEIFFH